MDKAKKCPKTTSDGWWRITARYLHIRCIRKNS